MKAMRREIRELTLRSMEIREIAAHLEGDQQGAKVLRSDAACGEGGWLSLEDAAEAAARL